MVTDLFGPDPSGSPGWLDAALLAGGLALALWAVVASRSTGLVVLGAIVASLGAVLPARSAWREVRRWRRTRKREALVSRGVALDVAHPLTRRLAEAYDALVEAARLPGVPLEHDAVRAAHAALLESVSLLDGGVPSTEAERSYLEKRIAAIRELTSALQKEHETLGAAARARGDERKAETRLEKRARVEAREEVEAILGESSVQELGDLTRQIEADRADGSGPGALAERP